MRVQREPVAGVNRRRRQRIHPSSARRKPEGRYPLPYRKEAEQSAIWVATRNLSSMNRIEGFLFYQQTTKRGNFMLDIRLLRTNPDL
jgi:hypothetical protein